MLAWQATAPGCIRRATSVLIRRRQQLVLSTGKPVLKRVSFDTACLLSPVVTGWLSAKEMFQIVVQC